MSGTLYVVSTPIGNLADISSRAVDVFKKADAILAEDTRVTLKLMSHLGISKKIYSYHEHSSEKKDQVIVEHLEEGESYALVSDAGTPCISDPGAGLVDAVLKAGFPVVPISGPSAVTTLMSVFGHPHQSFHFWGFFPIKRKKQKQILEYVNNIPGVHVFFESPMRILKTLERYFLEDTGYKMVIGREMTKMFETFYRGAPAEIMEELKKGVSKGEFCVGVMRDGI